MDIDISKINADTYLTTKEASALTKLSKHTLYNYRFEGKIPVTKNRGKIYWKKLDLLEFMGVIPLKKPQI